MKYNFQLVKNVLAVIILSCSKMYAQDSAAVCKVKMENIAGTYSGECRNGYANGKGEAKGIHHYLGLFKNGLPNGKGIYYYNDSLFYSGNFQDGIKEGKGETHDLRNPGPDSLIKGYWSGGEYRGKTYKTYLFNNNVLFDLVSINASDASGNTLTITTSTILTLTGLISTDGTNIKRLNGFSSPAKISTTYELEKFPVRLQATFANGQTCDLELFKQANWKAELLVYHLQ